MPGFESKAHKVKIVTYNSEICLLWVWHPSVEESGSANEVIAGDMVMGEFRTGQLWSSTD